MDIQTISIVVAAVGVFIAAINSVISSRRAEEQRQTQLLAELYETYRSTEFRQQLFDFTFVHEWTTFDEFTEQFDPKVNPEGRANIGAVLCYYDGIGFLVRNRMLDIRFVEELLGRSAIRIWAKFGPVYQELKRTGIGPLHFEYLVHEMDRRQRVAGIHYPM